jgi:hypothetical protein
MSWLVGERYRVFAALSLVTLTVGFLLFSTILKAVPLSLLLIVTLALISASSAVAALFTLLADRRGETDASNLWDGNQTGDSPASFLPGFGAAPQNQAALRGLTGSVQNDVGCDRE